MLDCVEASAAFVRQIHTSGLLRRLPFALIVLLGASLSAHASQAGPTINAKLWGAAGGANQCCYGGLGCGNSGIAGGYVSAAGMRGKIAVGSCRAKRAAVYQRRWPERTLGSKTALCSWHMRRSVGG